MPNSYSIRRATKQDALLIGQQRRLMFAEGSHYPDTELSEMQTQYAAWIGDKLSSGDYLGWFAEDTNSEPIAGVGLWLREWPPILKDYTGKQGYIENVYTAPAHRRRGLARRLMTELLDWARTSGRVYNIELHATDMALPLYQSLGFETAPGLMVYWLGLKHPKADI